VLEALHAGAPSRVDSDDRRPLLSHVRRFLSSCAYFGDGAPTCVAADLAFVGPGGRPARVPKGAHTRVPWPRIAGFGNPRVPFGLRAAAECWRQGQVFDTIVLAVDRGDSALAMVEVTSEIARKFGGEVLVLHVREVDHPAPEQLHEARDLVDRITRQLKDEGVPTRGEVLSTRSRWVAREIGDWARTQGAGLVVMESRRMSELRGLISRNVAHQVEQRVDCPVLAVRY
jgi:nucleotide-binding universal stress UspA family protein